MLSDVESAGSGEAHPEDSRAGSLRALLDALAVGLCCASLPELNVLHLNPALVELLGCRSLELQALSNLLTLLPRDADRLALENQFAAWRDPGSGQRPDSRAVELTIATQAGPEKVVSVHLSEFSQEDAAPCLLLTFIDITRHKQQEQEARKASLLLAHSHEMIVISPEGDRALFVSPAVEEVTGWSQQEYAARDMLEMVHPEDRSNVRELRRKIVEEGVQQHLRYRALVKDGSYRWVEGFGAPYRDSEHRRQPGYVVSLRDIAKQKEHEDTLALENSQLAELAQLDELTGIANRRVFKSALTREARRKSRSSQALALLLLDVDNFKKYNDMYGHLQGDACLRQVAQTLKKVLHRVADLVARYGGEEFVMLLPMTEPGGAERVAQNVLQAISGLRIPHAGTPYGIVTVSVGVSTWATSTLMDEERLIEEADRALYKAKNQGRNGYAVSHCMPEENVPAR